ncbi:MAG: hypothetical protein ACRDK8_10410 [Solirubrobacteraceae bacterium]
MIAGVIGSTGGTDEPLQVVLANRLGRLPTLLILDHESRTAALALAGPAADAEASARARAVPASLRIQRVLDLSARALSTAGDR